MLRFLLIASFLLILPACSKDTVIVSKDRLVFTPDSLLQDPCEAVGAGDSVRTLAKGYVANTSCLGQYKLLLEKQRKHKAEVDELFKDGNTTREHKVN